MSETLLVREEATQNYLLVEGNDDVNILCHLLKHHNIYNQVEIKNKGGVENLLETLRTELKGSGERRLGIIIDADTDIAVRWQALRDRLVTFGYLTVPSAPLPNGTILDEDGQPVIGVWLMPDNKLPGMIEDFVSFLVPQGDALWPMAEDVVRRVIEVERRFPPHDGERVFKTCRVSLCKEVFRHTPMKVKQHWMLVIFALDKHPLFHTVDVDKNFL
jgi:uncharacterized protein DUF3226